jgi:hypothetical protein
VGVLQDHTLISFLEKERSPYSNTPLPLEKREKRGHCEIRSPLGAGGVGELYLAQHTKPDRKMRPTRIARFWYLDRVCTRETVKVESRKEAAGF